MQSFIHTIFSCTVGMCKCWTVRFFVLGHKHSDISGTEAEAAEGLWGDLNAEDLETPFLLM